MPGAGVGHGDRDGPRVGPGAAGDGDGAVLDDGLGGVHQQVQEHLVELAGVARHQGQLAEVAHHLRLVLQLVPGHLQGRFQARVQVRRAASAVLGAGEVLEVQRDVAHPLGALLRLGQQAVQVPQHVVDVPGLAGRGHPGLGGGAGGRVVAGGPQRVVGGHQVLQGRRVLDQRPQVGHDEAHRIVDLVGHAGGQLADARHLLRLHQPGLGGLQGVHGLAQLPRALQHPVLENPVQVPDPGLGRLALADLAAQVGQGGAQLVGHVVDGAGQGAHLVGAVHGHPPVQVAVGDLPGRRPHGVDGAQQRTVDHHVGEGRRQAGHGQEEPGAHPLLPADRTVDGRQLHVQMVPQAVVEVLQLDAHLRRHLRDRRRPPPPTSAAVSPPARRG